MGHHPSAMDLIEPEQIGTNGLPQVVAIALDRLRIVANVVAEIQLIIGGAGYTTLAHCLNRLDPVWKKACNTTDPWGDLHHLGGLRAGKVGVLKNGILDGHLLG